MDYWMYKDYLAHHGVKGQSWGKRRFQNIDGILTPEGRQRYGIGPALMSGARNLSNLINKRNSKTIASTKNYSVRNYNNHYIGLDSNKNLGGKQDNSTLFGLGKVDDRNRYYAERYTGEEDKDYYDKQIGKVCLQSYSQEGYKVFQVTFGNNIKNSKVSDHPQNVAIGKDVINNMARLSKTATQQNNGHNQLESLQSIKGKVAPATTIVANPTTATPAPAKKTSTQKVNAPTKDYSYANTKQVTKKVNTGAGVATVQFKTSTKSSGNTTADMEQEKGKKSKTKTSK